MLDYNFPLGGALVPLCLPVLLYAAAPSRQAAVAPGRPSYSLWHLEERQRHDWLAALLTVLYKVRPPRRRGGGGTGGVRRGVSW